MTRYFQRASAQDFRRVAASQLANATGPVSLRVGNDLSLGDGSHGALFNVPISSQFADKSVNALFNVRAYAPSDERFLLSLKESGAAPHLFAAPAADSLHVPTYMPNVLERYRNNDMIAKDIFPVIKVGKRSDKIASVPMGIGMSNVDTKLAGQATSMPPELDWSVATRGTYLVEDYGLVSFIPADSVTNEDAPFEVRQTTAEILGDTLDLGQELLVKTVVTTTGSYASGYSTAIATTSAQWDNPNSDPANAMRGYRKKVLKAPGTKIVCVLGHDVFIALQQHPKVLAAFYGRAATDMGATPTLIAEKQLASLFNVDEVIVGRAKYNSANDGQTVSMVDVWTNFAALVCVQTRPSPIRTNGFAYQYRYNNEAMDVQFIPWLLPGVRGGEYCKVTHSTQAFVTSPYSGYLVTNVLTNPNP
jgi:hypothetical protein